MLYYSLSKIRLNREGKLTNMKKWLIVLLVTIFIAGCQAADEAEPVTPVEEATTSVTAVIDDGRYFEVNNLIAEVEAGALSAEEKTAVKDNISTRLITEIDTLTTAFENDDVGVSTFNNTLKEFEAIELDGVPEKVNDVRTNHETLIASREAFRDGEKFMEIDYHDMAIAAFMQVAETDAKYEAAQDYLAELSE